MVLPMTSSRQVLAWSLPTLAFLLSILWYRRRNRGPKPKTDPGGTFEAIPVDKALPVGGEAALPPSDYYQSVLADKLAATDDQLCPAAVAEERKDFALACLPDLGADVIPVHSSEIATFDTGAVDNSVNIEDIVLISSSLTVQHKSESETIVQQDRQVQLPGNQIDKSVITEYVSTQKTDFSCKLAAAPFTESECTAVTVPESENTTKAAVARIENTEAVIAGSGNIEVTIAESENTAVTVPESENTTKAAVARIENTEAVIAGSGNIEVTIAESENTAVTVPESENTTKAAVARIENTEAVIAGSGNTEVTIVESENTAVTVPESESTEATVAGSDNIEVTVPESENSEPAVAGSESCKPAVADCTAVAVAESGNTETAETASIAVIIAESESTAVAIAESGSTETAETASIAVVVAESKSTAVAVAESGSTETAETASIAVAVAESGNTETAETASIAVRVAESESTAVSVSKSESTEVAVVTESDSSQLSTDDKDSHCLNMTEVEEQKVGANQGDNTVDVSEVAAPSLLSKISVDVSSAAPKAAEQDDDGGAKAVSHQPRDSANHSPAEAMLASPSMSHDSDTHSVGSNDSGKGGSGVTTPVVEEEVDESRGPGKKRSVARGGSRRRSSSSRSSDSCMQGTATHPATMTAAGRSHTVSCSSNSATQNASSDSGIASNSSVALPCIYEFVIPQQLVGRLIGKHGCFVQQIKYETNSSIFVKRHPESPKFKVCAIEGTQADIEGALKLIRKKFPVKKYPAVTLERVMFLQPVVSYPLVPESLQMYLVECVNNDVILSSLVSAGHMFLQQPTHPTFPMLSRLIMSMTQCYSEEDSPALPNLAPGIICAAPSQGSWYRAEVIDVRTATAEELEENSQQQEDSEEITVCDIKFVDYGGYMTLTPSELRQIRTDFMMLPFQATECYLADITWPDGEDNWSAEATQCVEELIRDQVLQAQVIGYADNCVPLIRLFSIAGHMPVMVNEILVHRGLAKYFEQ